MQAMAIMIRFRKVQKGKYFKLKFVLHVINTTPVRSAYSYKIFRSLHSTRLFKY